MGAPRRARGRLRASTAIPLPLPNDGLRAVNVYVIEDGDGLVLIDGGWAMADATEILERGLGEIDRRLRDIREFLVTHLHRDHYTQAIAVRQVTGSPVSVGEGEKACLDAIHSIEVHPDIARMHLAGAETSPNCSPAGTASAT